MDRQAEAQRLSAAADKVLSSIEGAEEHFRKRPLRIGSPLSQPIISFVKDVVRWFATFGGGDGLARIRLIGLARDITDARANEEWGAECIADIASLKVLLESELRSTLLGAEPSGKHARGRSGKAQRRKAHCAFLDEQLAKKRWSDLELANNGGPSFNTIKRYRSGESSNRDGYVKGKLADALGVDVSLVP